MPTPKKNEAKQDYLKRCTSELVGSEGKNEKQAFAMCNRYWDESKGTRASMNLAAEIYLAKEEQDEDARKFLITAYTGQVIDRFWGKVILNTKGIERLPKFPVYKEHNRDAIVGHATESWLDGVSLLVAGVISQHTDAAQEVKGTSGEGFPWQASVSVAPVSIRILQENEKAKVNGINLEGPIEIWESSRLSEVSFVGSGADRNTAAIVLSEGDSVPVEFSKPTNEITITLTNGGSKIMDLETLKKDHPEIFKAAFAEGVQSVDLAPAFYLGCQSERDRVTELMEAGADQVTTAKVIKEGMASADAYKMFYQASKQANTDAQTTQANTLTNLANQAPSTLGAQTPAPPEGTKKETRTADQILHDEAVKLSQEKGISMGQATELVMAAMPELCEELMFLTEAKLSAAAN